MTLKEAIKGYEMDARIHLRPRTWANRKSLLRQLEIQLGDRALEKIDAACLDAYSRARLSTIKPVSVNSELRAFSAIRHWAIRRGVATGIAPKALRERPSLRVRSWTPAEVRRLFEAAAKDSPTIAALTFLLAHSGLRCGEALALRWSEVDLDRRLLRIWPRSDWTTKSGRPREVPIGDRLLVELRRWPRRSEWVFPSGHGTPYARWPQRSFDRACAAAGLRGGPHTLRHTYATEFLSRGGSIAALAQILGHSDERVTRIYAHLRPDHLAALRNVVDFGPGIAVDFRPGISLLARPLGWVLSTGDRIFARLSRAIFRRALALRSSGRIDRGRNW